MSIKRLPLFLTLTRLPLGLLLVYLCLSNGDSSAILAVLLAAMLSDIFDGVIARKLDVVTAPLRVADSVADAWFFGCVGLSAILAHAPVLRAYWVPIALEGGLQAASYVFDLIKYRKICALHAYSAKAWGFSLYLAAIGLLAYNSGAFIWVAFGLGLISFCDALAIKLLLPQWQHDVGSCVQAWRQARPTRHV